VPVGALIDPQARREDAATSGTAVWLNLVHEPIYATLHEPETQHRNIAVLMLPTFGWDESCSYRARRHWASSYAEAGFPTVRFDLPGSEDSVGSPLAPSRFGSWVEAVTAVAAWLRQSSGADRVVAVGIGLGGLLAREALCVGAGIDDLVLWATPSRGRSYIRELRMYADAMSRDGSEPERADGAIAIGGHLMSKQTVDAISAASGVVQHAADRRILMIERDTNGIDEALRTQFVASGADVTVMPSDEYLAMMTFPDWSRLPTQTIAASVQWLETAAGRNPAPRSLLDSSAVAREISFEYDGQMIRERQVTFDTVAGALVGILSEPVGLTPKPLCLISHNAGAIRRTGPGRMWTDMCRRSAARGLPSLRVDIEGVGDSSGRFVKNAERGAQDEYRIISSRVEIADLLEVEGVATRFVSVGLCLAAYWEFKVAVRDPRLRGTILLNHLAFDWTPEAQQERVRRSALGVLRHVFKPLPDGQRALTLESIRRMAYAVVLTLRGSVSAAERSQFKAAVRQFDSLLASHTRILMLFSSTEALYGQMRGSGLLGILSRWPEIQVEELPSKDHDLRPLHVQALVHERVDRFIDELLATPDS